MFFTIIVFALALGILVFVHEWGHYIVAKLSGVWVRKFSIGFGPKIIGFTKNGTDYRIAPIPLGGYVDLYGQDPYIEADGDLKKADEIAKDPKSFQSKPMVNKMATVLGGPLMNIIFAMIVMPMVFMIGRPEYKVFHEPAYVYDIEAESGAAKAGFEVGDKIVKFNDNEINTFKDLNSLIPIHPNLTVPIVIERDGQTIEKMVTLGTRPDLKMDIGFLGIEIPYVFAKSFPVVDQVLENSPAHKAGFEMNDRVVEVNGEAIKSWDEMSKLVQDSEGKALNVVVARPTGPVKERSDLVLNRVQTTQKSLTVTPTFNKEADSWTIGITRPEEFTPFVMKKYGFAESVVLGQKELIKTITLIGDVFGKLFSGQLSYKTLGGPIQIAKITSVAARNGFADFLYFLAFFSLQLGLLNLLPIPVLDGGHLCFMALETVRGKPLPHKVRQAATQIGMFMILGLMITITLNDIDMVWGFDKIFGFFTGS